MPVDFLPHFVIIPSEISSPIPLLGVKVWKGDFETPFLVGRGVGFFIDWFNGGDEVNLNFLGDALDHWKGSLISILSSKWLIRNVVVEPMITDERPWSKHDLDTYRRLLRLESASQICHGQSTFSGKREEYFDEIPQEVDVFLDPDTGIATDKGNRKHVKVSELGNLLAKSDRVLMIYQHSARGSFCKWLLEIKKGVSYGIPGVHCTIYECGRVALFFISLSKARIHEIQNALKEYLKGTADKRVWGDN